MVYTCCSYNDARCTERHNISRRVHHAAAMWISLEYFKYFPGMCCYKIRVTIVQTTIHCSTFLVMTLKVCYFISLLLAILFYVNYLPILNTQQEHIYNCVKIASRPEVGNLYSSFRVYSKPKVCFRLSFSFNRCQTIFLCMHLAHWVYVANGSVAVRISCNTKAWQRLAPMQCHVCCVETIGIVAERSVHAHIFVSYFVCKAWCTYQEALFICSVTKTFPVLFRKMNNFHKQLSLMRPVIHTQFWRKWPHWQHFILLYSHSYTVFSSKYGVRHLEMNQVPSVVSYSMSVAPLFETSMPYTWLWACWI